MDWCDSVVKCVAVMQNAWVQFSLEQSFFFVYSNMSPVNNAVVAGTLFFFLCDTDNFKLLHLNLQSAGAYLLAMDRGTRVCAT